MQCPHVEHRSIIGHSIINELINYMSTEFLFFNRVREYEVVSHVLT